MLYCLFKKRYLGLKKEFTKIDAPRLAVQVFPEEVKITTFSYGNDEMQKLNLLKINDEDKPLLIDVHGGAWLYGDHNLNNLFCCNMCQRCYDIISIGYRLIDGKILLRDMLNDTISAIKYAKDHRKEFKINFNDVYLTGDSAGGHLALVISKLLSDKKLCKELGFEEIDVKIKAVCINHAVTYTNFAGTLEGQPLLTKYVSIPGMMRIMYGKNYKKDKLFNSLYTPEVYINKEGDIPPLFILTSEHDRKYYYQSKMLHDYLESINYEHLYLDEKRTEGAHVYNVIWPETDIGSYANSEMDKFFRSKK